MSQDKISNPKDNAADVLKEVNQKAADQSNDYSPNDDQPDPEEVKEQRKGSDADADRNVGQDDLPGAEEAAEEIEGSDADKA